MIVGRRSVIALAVATLFTTSAERQASAQVESEALVLELNSAQPSDKGCRLTFVVTNRLMGDLSHAAFEIALFNEQGVVDRLTVLDFRDLPAGKTKVTRFDLNGVDCAKISRVLVNHATECVGDKVETTACLRWLDPQSKASIAFGV